MVFQRNTWFADTLNEYDFELILKMQPDNISQLPLIKEFRISIYTSEFRHSIGLADFIKTLAGPLGIKDNPLPFAVKRDGKKKRMISFHLRLFPYHRNLGQLIWFFFSLRIKHNCLLLAGSGALPNELCFKITELSHFTAETWNNYADDTAWGTPIWVSLISPKNVEIYAPLFKFKHISVI